MRRIAACLLACMSIVVVYFALPVRAATAGTVDAWGGTQVIPGMPTAEATALGGIYPVGISCPSAGNCTAVAQPNGTPGADYVYVASQANGTWGEWQAIPGTSAFGSLVFGVGVSCPSVGNCTIIGSYVDASNTYQTFAADETNGTWENATEVPGMTVVEGVSCWSAGNCVAAGTDQPAVNGTGRIYPVVATESGGTWSSAEQIMGISLSSTTIPLVVVASLSCDSAGNCAAAWDFNDPDNIAYVASETDGTWSSAAPIQGVTTLPKYDGNGYYATSVSCAPAGGCTVVGSYGFINSASFAVTESGGTWSKAAVIPGTVAYDPTPAQAWMPVEISCVGTRDCSTVGPNWVDTETSGKWGTATPISGLSTIDPGLANLFIDGISCGAPGYCSVVGTAYGTAFVVDEAGGTWAPAQALNVPGNYGGGGAVISCATATSCTTVDAAPVPATAQDPAQYVLFSASKSVTQPTSTTTTLAVSAPRLVYGDEQAETITATVSGHGIPAWGTVTVTSGTAHACTIFVRAGTGSCTLARTSLPGGTASLVGRYGGNGTLASSASAAGRLTIAKAATKVALSLHTSRITYGKETTEKLAVAVTPQYAGALAGTVTISATAGKTTTVIARIGLRSGKGSYTFTARQLKAGGYTLVAKYAGNTDYTGSTSAKKALTVLK